MYSRKLIIWILILNSIVLNSCFSSGISCEIVNEEFKCKIPVELDVQKMDLKWGAEIVDLEIDRANKQINFKLVLTNPAFESISIDYYSYLYKANKCLSCVEKRNETLKSIIVGKRSQEKIPITLTGEILENSSLKVKFKESHLKTWKEIKKDIQFERIVEEKVSTEFVEENVNQVIKEQVKNASQIEKPKSKNEMPIHEDLNEINFEGNSSKNGLIINISIIIMIFLIVCGTVLKKRNLKSQ